MTSWWNWKVRLIQTYWLWPTIPWIAFATKMPTFCAGRWMSTTSTDRSFPTSGLRAATSSLPSSSSALVASFTSVESYQCCACKFLNVFLNFWVDIFPFSGTSKMKFTTVILPTLSERSRVRVNPEETWHTNYLSWTQSSKIQIVKVYK